jgi:hypothetical protein
MMRQITQRSKTLLGELDECKVFKTNGDASREAAHRFLEQMRPVDA